MFAQWEAHLCGLCLSLRDNFGQLARVATNYDALVVSALVEAQSPDGGQRRVAGRCPGRQLRRVPVAIGPASALAAGISLSLAATKVADHHQDGDGRRLPLTIAARATAGWQSRADAAGQQLGVELAELRIPVAQQQVLENAARPGSSILLITQPTETATGAAFAAAATVAGCPDNTAALDDAGRAFGRIAHLLDAVEDQRADDAAARFNPITATGTSLATVRRHCLAAVARVRAALDRVRWQDDALVRLLLDRELAHAVERTFAHQGLGGHAHEGAAVSSDQQSNDRQSGDKQSSDKPRPEGKRSRAARQGPRGRQLPTLRTQCQMCAHDCNQCWFAPARCGW